MSSPSSPQFQFYKPSPTPAIIGLIVLCSVGWLATVIFEPVRAVASASLRVDSMTIPQLELWATLSYALFPLDFLNLFLEGLMIYFFGSDVARKLGDGKWIGVMLVATFVGGALGALSAFAFGGLVGGPAAALNACVAMYCWDVWQRRLSFFGLELTGKTMLTAFVVIDFVFALLAMNPTMFLVQIGGILVGLAVSSGMWRPKILRRHFHYWRVKRNLKVVARTPEHDSKRRRKDGTWIN